MDKKNALKNLEEIAIVDKVYWVKLPEMIDEQNECLRPLDDFEEIEKTKKKKN